MKKLLISLLTAVLVTAGLTGCSAFGSEGDSGGKTKLTISYQDTAFPALIKASGVLDGADFDVEWVNLTGPAANLQALYSGAIDLGHMGDTSLTIEQANAKTEWTADNAPLEIVAGWRNPYSEEYSPLVTAVRTSAGIDDLSQAKGHTWGYNFGGYNHAQYLVSLVKAGLSEQDIKPTQFADGATSAAAFNNGEVDVYSGAHGAILSSLTSGDAKILLDDSDTDIPALNVWTARKDVLADDDKNAALKDFFSRMSGYWAWHDDHPDEVKDILKKQLKVDDARADFEFQVRRGQFQAFDDDLITREQAVAQSLFDGGAIAKLPDVGIGFDPRYNEVQKAVPDAGAPE
ncbi:ABC transporter substrate-binding protein [Nocardioides anomalus]|uniref:ABC transporter substrate-binding protein n=1 Tax=Nocardioides anomalus TaxID=2712223 RepID=A0A6G6WCL6_9ACTN|nr:ABC transporter substrate-binding protein [Nocardioides anomalus]QIG42893.1 ABC transporter substrate-binding protein [Nocardioides anomalus]